MALARGQREYERAVEEDTELLRGFGLRLLSVQGGVRAAVESELKGSRIDPWNVMEINTKTWTWLRPLLVELSETRQSIDVPAIVLAAK
jgi:hypothetical protein